MINKIKNAIREAFKKLMALDGNLFKCPIEEHADYDSRKLHEVCINHKLAIYLEEFLFPEITANAENYFIDIEFNREGIDFKNLQYNGQEKRIRPDIIIHNRKSGKKKKNLLVAECKKVTAPNKDKEDDISKIKAFLTDEKYKYIFGLQVIYSKHEISGTLFFIDDGNIVSHKITEQYQITTQ